jgi:hypothetical protein
MQIGFKRQTIYYWILWMLRKSQTTNSDTQIVKLLHFIDLILSLFFKKKWEGHMAFASYIPGPHSTSNHSRCSYVWSHALMALSCIQGLNTLGLSKCCFFIKNKYENHVIRKKYIKIKKYGRHAPYKNGTLLPCLQRASRGYIKPALLI